jgi:hypothetical protein
MSKYAYNAFRSNINAVNTANGNVVTANYGGASTTFGVTLANATNYVFPFGADNAPMPSETAVVTVHLKWDNATAFTAVVEECGFPRTHPDQTSTVDDVSDHNTTVGYWILVRPPDAYVEVAGGGTYTIGTGVIAVTAGQAGGCTITLSDWGARRGRIRLTVTTGGLHRCAVHGKLAA